MITFFSVSLINSAFINAVTVLPLAVVAYGVSRWAERPALTHALWAFVLLKLVTPPLIQLPITVQVPADVARDWSASASSTNGSSLATSAVSGEEVANSQAVFNSTSSSNDSSVVDRRLDSSSADSMRVVPSHTTPGVRAEFGSSAWSMWRPSWMSMILTVWLAGATFWVVMQSVRAIRFQRLVVRGATTNRAMQLQTEELAAAMGLRCGPRVLIVEATVSPMLWGCGARAKLLFPSLLVEQLDEAARATLLTHELAHFARGDHWVRLLELIATTLFWWHPVVWWARHQIEEAEEECCDAWVVRQFPHAPRCYAEALLDTIDFLCESRRSLPPVACGLGQAHFIRHRLTKIMQGAAPKVVSPQVRVAMFLSAALLLPMQPFVFGSASKTPMLRTVIPPDLPLIDSSSFESLPSNILHETPAGSESSEDEAGSTPSNASNSAPIPKSSKPKSRALRGEKVWSTAVSQDGRFVVRATTGRRVLLNDLSLNTEVDLSSHGITAVSFTPDGQQFVAVANDGRVTLWDAVTSELKRVLQTHDGGLRSVSVSPRGDAVVVGGHDGTLLVLDLNTGESLVPLSRQSLPVNCVRFSPDGSRLAVALGEWSSNRQGQVKLIDMQTATTTVLKCDSTPGAITFASNDELIVGQWNGRATLWNLIQRQIVGAALADKNIIAAASFSPDNPQLREIGFVSPGLGRE